MPEDTSDRDFSVRASRARTKIECALNESADHLEEIRDKIEQVKNIEPQGAPFLATQQDLAELANFQGRKAEALKVRKAEERQTLAVIADGKVRRADAQMVDGPLRMREGAASRSLRARRD